MPPNRFSFDRRGAVVGDVRGAQVVFTREPYGKILGDVRGWYRDEDETLRLCVTFFNGEPWPIDPPAAIVVVLERSHAQEAAE